MTGTYTLIEANRQHAQNIAAIAAEFHTHRLYNDFYDAFGKLIDGFIGNYEICIQMAEALTDWELEHGGLMAYEDLGTPWIEIVEKYVDTVISGSVQTEELPNAPYALRGIIAAVGGQS